ncbi:MAG: hypothetical protein KGZ25_03765 [Planctomycetes bacterium]|nr:hypothetical protein [Planctomycetota bacterium]
MSVSTMEDRLARWESFIEGESPFKFLFYVNFSLPEEEEQLPPAVPPWPDRADERVERRWAEYELMCKKTELVEDDRVPYISNMTGTEIFAEAFGCEVHRPDDTNPFALPMVHTAREADALETPELSTSSLSYLFDIADELFRRGGSVALMKPVDIQSPMDIVALIWDKSDLFCAMVETPEAVIALAEKVRALLISFFDEWFGRYGTTFVAHYPDYVMADGLTLSVDEVGSINEEMFCQFFRDGLVAISDHFGGLGIHCCADARHQWNNFRSLPGLRVINHNAPPTRDARKYLLDSLRFYGDAAVQIPLGWQPDGQPKSWPDQFPEETRVVFWVQAEGAAGATAIARRLQEIRNG